MTASDTLTMQSGNDTKITGSQVGGKTVKVDVGGNLNISSLQDTETYRGDSSSMGGGISVSMSSGSKKDWLDDSFRKYDSTPYVPGTTGGSAFLGKGNMDSDYASVTQQAGIYAGKGGFTVHVEDNTRLTGSLLDSTASEDKNSLTTGTLTMEDMGNKAEYDVKNIGVSYHHYGSEAARQVISIRAALRPLFRRARRMKRRLLRSPLLRLGRLLRRKSKRTCRRLTGIRPMPFINWIRFLISVYVDRFHHAQRR